MFIFESIAIENLVSSYAARFRPNPDTEGYLFNKDDYGVGVPCSTEKYEAYVYEFEAFVARKTRFMWKWFFAMILIAIVGLVAAVYYLGTDILDDNNHIVETIGGALMVLPLLFIFKEGWELYKKPETELNSNGEIGRELQSKEEIMNRRFKGMSPMLIVFGLFISGLGLYVSLSNFDGGYDSPYMKYFFALIFAGFAWLGIKKYKAHQIDAQRLEEQTYAKKEPISIYRLGNNDNIVYVKKDTEVRQSHHDLVDAAVYGGDKSSFHKIIDTHAIPKRGEPAYNGIDKQSSYLHLLNEHYQEVSRTFLINLDWKEGVSEFHNALSDALKGTPYTPKLPSVSSYPSDASILYGYTASEPLSKVFREYILALNEVGLGLVFLETHADFFMLFMYKLEEEKEVREIISNTGNHVSSPA